MEEGINIHLCLRSGNYFKIRISELIGHLSDYINKHSPLFDEQELNKLASEITTLIRLKEDLIKNLNIIENLKYIEDEENLVETRDIHSKINFKYLKSLVKYIISVLDEQRDLSTNQLKIGVYHKIKDELDKREFHIHKKYKHLSNWEVHFYYALTYLKRKGYIQQEKDKKIWQFTDQSISIMESEEENVTDIQNEFDDDKNPDLGEMLELDKPASIDSLTETKNIILSRLRNNNLLNEFSLRDWVLNVVDEISTLDDYVLVEYNEILLDEKYKVKTFEQENITEVIIKELFLGHSVFLGVDDSGKEDLFYFAGNRLNE